MLYIEVPDMNDSMSNITIDETEYMIRFTYNEKYDYWSFGLYDEDSNPIIAMTKIVPSFPLLMFYTDSRLPKGQFAVICEKDSVGREDFNEGYAEFVYISPED